MQETLAHEWRKRMAARSTVCAMLLAIPVLVVVLIGFNGGLGALPFGISSLATGPSEQSISVNGQRPSSAVSRLVASASATTTTVAAPATTGGGGGQTTTGGGTGVDTGTGDGTIVTNTGTGTGTGTETAPGGGSGPTVPVGGGDGTTVGSPGGASVTVPDTGSSVVDDAANSAGQTVNGLLGGK
jgi:hypothetical protein